MVKVYDAATSDGKARLTIWAENPPPPDVLAFWESGQRVAATYWMDDEGRVEPCSTPTAI
ncbi:MAG: hypothetical protein QOF36_2583 [Microbacteriaceae bacterium]|jgi:hypothetical protein|nr:hypothetical protein [Microbacteriaceae bacterium]